MVALLDHRGNPLPSAAKSKRWGAIRKQAKRLKAKYDAAQTTDQNIRHWVNADSNSPAADAGHAVRKILRERSRYEFLQNNSLGRGIVLTLANDLIGTGPRLQVHSDNEQANRQIETAFRQWAREVKLAKKLRTMQIAKAVDGEAFAIFTTNKKLRSPVKLDILPLEADYFHDPWFTAQKRNEVDAIRLDENKNPQSYHMLDDHPGEAYTTGWKGKWIDESQVIHWFFSDRSGKQRGIPEGASALPWFADMRRYVAATIAAAETAAEFAAVMYSDAPALGDEDIEAIEAMDAIEIERRMMLTLPFGWKMGQFKAEHPNTTFEMFRRCIINEMARCFNMPFNVAAADSSSYNYASGRLDHQVYHRALDVARQDCELDVLDKIFYAWLDEAIFVAGLIPDNIGQLALLPHAYLWPGHRHVDPLKEAMAAIALHDAGLLTDEEYISREGGDIDEHYQSYERQIQRRSEIEPNVQTARASLITPDLMSALLELVRAELAPDGQAT